MPVPEDFKKLLPPKTVEEEAYTGPLYWLWSHDPGEDKIHLFHNEGVHPALHRTHKDIDITHPDRTNGFAYHIKGGYRITNADHGPVDDPHIIHLVHAGLRGEQPKPQLPHIPYHGDIMGVL